MQFLKKNYEKILLGIVLVGLVGAAVFMLLVVGQERQAQEDLRNRIISRPFRPLEPPDISFATAVLRRGELPVIVSFSDNTNRLFNPVRWQRAVDGRIIKNPVGSDLERLQITGIDPLYLRVSLGSISVSESSVRYAIVIEQQAARRANMRGPRSYYVSVGEKKEYGEDKDTFVLREVRGAPNEPTELIIELSDSEKPISIARDKPYERIDGYMADMRYPPENRMIPNRRVGDRVVIANEEYNIVSITENEVGLSAKSNQKRWTIKYDRPR